MAGKSVFQEDLARNEGRVRWTNRTLWAIACYRLGRRLVKKRDRPFGRALFLLFLPFSRLVETVTKISLPAEADIGGGLRIIGGGLIFLHNKCVIGRNCTLRQGVTIGNAREDGRVPVVGDNVEFGAYAQVLGDIRIGDGAKIATMSVVLNDVPAGAAVAGIPAKIASRTELAAAVLHGDSMTDRGGDKTKPEAEVRPNSARLPI